MIDQLKQMPEVVEEMLQQEDKMAEFAKLLTNQKDAYFIGRQLDYLSVLEGALKLKRSFLCTCRCIYGWRIKTWSYRID